MYVRENGYSDAELLKRGLLRNASRSKRGALIGRHAREELWTRFTNGAIKPMDADVAEGEAVLEEDDFTSSVVAPLLENVDMAKAELKKVQGKVFTNAASKVSAVVSGQTLSKSHAAQMSVRNLTALGYSKEDARKIHYSACAKMHEIFESADDGFFEENYDTKNKKNRKGAWHCFGIVMVEGFGAFGVNVSAIAHSREASNNTLFTLELTIENPSEIGSDTLSQRGRALLSEGFSGHRVSAYRSFVEKEMLDIRKKAEADGTFMKAPNGKDTNLSETQWLQVRTAAFKRWFGDWEKVARFRAVREEIMNMPVVAKLTGQEFQSDGVRLTDKVPAYWADVYQGAVESLELGRVVLDKEGVQSSIGHGVGRLKAAAFYAVPDVIQKGRVFDRQKDWKGRGYDTAVIAAPISIGEKEYICEVVVEQRSNRQGFYVHEVEIKEKLGNVFKTATEGSTRQASRSILVLRDSEVNTLWEICSKIVDENGEPMVVYHGARHAGFRLFDNEEGDRRSDAPDGSNFFSPSRAVAYSYAGSYE